VKKRSRYRLAENLEAAGRLAEAAAVLQPMTEDFPDDYLPYLTLGKVLGRMGNYRGAERVLRHAQRLAPEKVQILYYLSLILMMQGQEQIRQGNGEQARTLLQEAVGLARRALTIMPDNGYAYMTLGLSLKELGERAEALIALRQAVRCNPELAELHFYLGDALAEDGREAEARPHLEQALEFGPADASWRQAARTRLAGLKKGTSSGKDPGK
jgi:Flp pilus assembly protein TadD